MERPGTRADVSESLEGSGGGCGQMSDVHYGSGFSGGELYAEGFRKSTHDSSQRNYRRRSDSARSTSASPVHHDKGLKSGTVSSEEEIDQEKNGPKVGGNSRDEHKNGPEAGGNAREDRKEMQDQGSNGQTMAKEIDHPRGRDRPCGKEFVGQRVREKDTVNETGRDAECERDRDNERDHEHERDHNHERDRDHYHDNRDERYRERDKGRGGGGREGERERERNFFYRQRNRGYGFHGNRGGRGWGGRGGDRGRDGYWDREPPHDRERLYGGGGGGGEFVGRKREYGYDEGAGEEQEQHIRNKKRGEWSTGGGYGDGVDRDGNGGRDGQMEASLERSRWFDHRDRGKGGERDRDTGNRKWDRMDRSGGHGGSGRGGGSHSGMGSFRSGAWEARVEDQGGHLVKGGPFSSRFEREGAGKPESSEVGRGGVGNFTFKREPEFDKATREQRREGRTSGDLGERDASMAGWGGGNRMRGPELPPGGKGRAFTMDGKEESHFGKPAFSSPHVNSMAAAGLRDNRLTSETWTEKAHGPRVSGMDRPDRHNGSGMEDRPGKSSRWGPEAQQPVPAAEGNGATVAGGPGGALPGQVKSLQEAVNVALASASLGQGCGMTEEQQHSAQMLAARKAAELVNRNLGVPGSMSAQEKKKLLWGAKKSTVGEQQRCSVAVYLRRSGLNECSQERIVPPVGHPLCGVS